jgi:SPP1 gp7 family putative phage head morphogenesis protein
VVDQTRLDDLGRPLTANERLLERTIRHAHYVQAVASHEARQILEFLDHQVLPDLRRQIAAGLAALDDVEGTTAKLNRLRLLEAQVTQILGRGMGEIANQQQGSLSIMAQVEGRMTIDAISSALPPQLRVGRFAIELDFPPPQTLQAIVRSQPIQGHLMADWWARLGTKSKDEMLRQARIGVTTGETTTEITKRMIPTARELRAGSPSTYRQIRREAEGIARTMTTGVTNAARSETMRANSDVVKGELWVATLDGVTCAICRALDGKTFALGEGQRPPAHLGGCRCSVSPVLKSLREMGLTDQDFEFSRGTRASMTGNVPDTTTYGEFLRTQSKEFQDETLGPKRAEMFRRGVVPIERFVDVQGRELRIDQLEALERRIEAGATKRLLWPGEIAA